MALTQGRPLKFVIPAKAGMAVPKQAAPPYNPRDPHNPITLSVGRQAEVEGHVWRITSTSSLLRTTPLHGRAQPLAASHARHKRNKPTKVQRPSGNNKGAE
jgi:hypothetical protein